MILLATAHNFADSNTFTCFRITIQELIESLDFKFEVPLNWFNEKKMTVILEKFQTIVISKIK